MSVYCSADWHGRASPALKLLDYLKPDDTLYFLGDATDRGPDGILLLGKLLEDSRVKYIKGNHEFFIESCIPLLLNDDETSFRNSYISQWLNENGGRPTWDELQKRDPATIERKYLNPIRRLPTEIIYESPLGHIVFLEHAGYTPWDLPHRTHDPLWDREHFLDPWSNKMPNAYIVHGHTPVQYLKYFYGYRDMPLLTKEDYEDKRLWFSEEKTKEKPTVIKYCNNHKIDIDMCTIVSKRVALLNLDTFETIYFDE